MDENSISTTKGFDVCIPLSRHVFRQDSEVINRPLGPKSFFSRQCASHYLFKRFEPKQVPGTKCFEKIGTTCSRHLRGGGLC